jgi:anti-sigma B factor antagonist
MAEYRFVIRGEIDLDNAPALYNDLTDATEHSSGNLVVDCGALTFIDSTGVSVLVSICEALHAQGRQFRVVNTDAITDRIFDILDVSEQLRGDDRISH